MSTKAERQQEWKVKHLKALATLGFIGSYRTLRTLENRAHWNAERLSSGEDWRNGRLISKGMTQEEYNAAQDEIKAQVKRLFNGTLPRGFFINGDPRGHALKIDAGNEAGMTYHPEYIPAGMHTDWGGYGILAPEEF